MNKLLKFKEFSELLEASIYKPNGKVSLRKPFWDAYYDSVSKSSPKGTKPKEIIRATFGLDSDGTAEKNIRKMFKTAGYPVDKIEQFDKGEVRDGKDLGSDIYHSYKITSNNEEYWVTNNTIELEDGGEQEIGKKELTPNKLGVENKVYRNKEELIRDIETGLSSLPNLNEDTRDFLVFLSKSVAEKAKSKYKDMEQFFTKGKTEEIIPLDRSYNLDSSSLKNIVNDYGEVLDGVYILSTIKKLDKGLEFPSGSNEALSDMWVDGWNVSSKAAVGGGRPSIDALVNVCANHKTNIGSLDLQYTEEEELFNIFLELHDLKASKSTLPTVETYTLLGKKFIDNGKLKDSGFEYFINTFRINLSTQPLHRKTIVDNLLKLAKKDPKEFESFMEEFWKRCGSVPKNPDSVDTFIKNKKGDSFYYPLAVEVTRVLNEYYADAMVTLVNKLLIIKQMYLGIDLKNEYIKFISTSSDSISQVKFAARGSTKTFNAGLGYEMKK